MVVWYPYDDLWATCVDNYDTSCSVTSSWSVNTTATWSTLITYNAIDAAGNDSSLTRTVNIVPWDVPVITLNGLSPITQEVHSSYTDLWANFSDTEDWTWSLVWTWIVDITTVWTYNITYDHTDISWNPAEQVTRTVNIVDTTDPIITLNWSWSITQEVWSTYTDAWAIMNDNYDATTNVTANWIVNSSSVWVYTLTYDYTDTNLNTATQVTRTVNIVDTTDPIITLNGSWSITQEVWSTYTDAWAIMNDNYDSTTLLSAVGTVDINTLGTYASNI